MIDFTKNLRKNLGLWGWITILVLAATLAISTPVLIAEAFNDQTPKANSIVITPQAQTNNAESNLPYLFAVYIITWGAFFVFLFYVSRRQHEIRAELEMLKRTLAQLEPADKPESENYQAS